MPAGAGGHSSAFDGLAVDDEDEAAVDAFSLLPPPDANDPVFGNEQQPPNAGRAASSGPSVPQRAARPAVPQRPAPRVNPMRRRFLMTCATAAAQTPQMEILWNDPDGAVAGQLRARVAAVALSRARPRAAQL